MRLRFIHTETLADVHTHTHYTHARSEVAESKDEEDFDQFLESVKARQLSLTAKGEPSLTHTTVNNTL